MSAVPPGWHPDPEARHQYRWWDGQTWTDQVADGGRVTRAPLTTGDGFDAVRAPQRTWGRRDVIAYADPARWARTFGPVSMPLEDLRVWEVMGEEQHQATLGALAGPKTLEGKWVEVVAELRPDPTNAIDADAVAVVIRGQMVGYLRRDEAARHRRLVDAAIAAHGYATCGAVINGGWFRSGERPPEGSYGVRLYFGGYPTPGLGDLPAKAADEDRIPYRIQDDHDHITVTGEEEHQAVLVDCLGDHWLGDHPFVLAELGVGTDKKGREAVTVSIDGHPVGCLTQKMTARFLPPATASEEASRRLTAAATLEPSKRKGHEGEIEVLLRVPKAWGMTV